MRKSVLLLALLTLAVTGYAQSTANTPDFADLVNPLIGTDSKPSLSNGNTFPAIALPWGMNSWMPQTGKMGSGWAYTYYGR